MPLLNKQLTYTLLETVLVKVRFDVINDVNYFQFMIVGEYKIQMATENDFFT